MKTQQSRDNLVWIDLEMTGLDPDKEKIIEIATLITDSQLNIIAEGPNLIINQSESLLDQMDEWNKNQHGSSGLIDEVKKSNITMQMAEIETLEFISKYVGHKQSPMCGNTVSHDRRFLIRHMPRLEEYFNYDLLMKNYDSFFNQIHIPENQRMFKFIAFAVWKKVYGL